jgi:integrase
MDQDLIQYIQKADLSPATKNSYTERIRQLERLFDKPIYTIIKDAPIKKLRTTYPMDTTYKMYLTVILSLFRHVPHLKEELAKQHTLWTNAFTQADKAIEERYKTNAPTEKQNNGYVAYAEIIQKRDTLKKGTIERLLVAMYTYIKPLRADFNQIRLYKSLPKEHEPNYIHMKKSGCILILNEYKTAKTHGTYEKELPKELCEELQASLESNPRDYLFETTDHKPFDKANSFNKFANRILQRIFEKPLTISLIRHAFISTLDFNTLTIKEKEEIAKEMCHTLRLQDQYRLIFKD